MQTGDVGADAVTSLTSRRAVLSLALAVLAGRVWSQPALPDPATPLRLIVPFTPGTGIDLIARTVGPRLGERLGRAVVVDNRVGASGNIGTEAVVRAAPNNNTLLVSVSTLVMNRSLYPRLPFDAVHDLEPVVLTSWGQLVLVTHPGTGWLTAGAMVRAAREHPGRINYASPGVGTPHHLSMELLKSTASIYLTHIPYRGSAPAVTDLLSGQVELMFLPIHVALPYLRSGRLTALGIGSDRRHPLLPRVPTLTEARAGRIEVAMWYGVFAPKGTSPEFVQRVNRELRDILAQPDVRKAFETQGMDPASSSPQEFARLVQRDAARWAELIKSRGITAE
jgi:tripartite-type tricarboxylate transporter receptor subunit TctC